jgi:RNA recognition motif-containing protein
MQIYIGNLSKLTTAGHLANLFLPFGTVRNSKIISDRATGHSLGYGVIEMDHSCGRRAIERLNRCLFMNSYVEIAEV